MRTLTTAEANALRESLQEIERRTNARATVTVEGLVRRWATFVEDVESGYRLSIYDYTNDLCVRDVLDDLIEIAPVSVRQDIREEISTWDDRYLFTTKESSVPLLPGNDIVGRARWYRVPRVLIGELRDDLISEGIISD